MGQLLVRNGWVALSTGTVKADLVVDGDKIRTVSSDPTGLQFDREIDAEGCYMLPGGVDPHVHTNLALGEYTARDNFAEVTRAAALGEPLPSSTLLSPPAKKLPPSKRAMRGSRRP